MNFWLQYSKLNILEEYINSIFGVQSSVTKISTFIKTSYFGVQSSVTKISTIIKTSYFGIKNNY